MYVTSYVPHNDVMSCTALRKLTQQSTNVEGKLEKRNVIRDYTNFDSQVYAPMTRIGMYLDTGSEQYNVKSRFTNTLEGEDIMLAYIRMLMYALGILSLYELCTCIHHCRIVGTGR